MTAAKTKTTKATPAKKAEEVEEVKTEEVPEETLEDNELLDEEIERLLPGPGESITLEDGTKVEVRPLKLRELFAAFKILTRGAAMSMGAVSFSLLSENQGQFAETLIALLLNAFPEADVEFCEFLRVMVDPVEPEGGWENREERLAAEQHLDEILLEDPEIIDAIDIITVVIHRESKDIQKLGKRIAGAAKMFGKVAPISEK